MSCFEGIACTVGQRVVVRPTGQIGTVERIEPRSRISGQHLVHVQLEECPWKLIQPQMTLQKREAEDG